MRIYKNGIRKFALRLASGIFVIAIILFTIPFAEAAKDSFLSVTSKHSFNKTVTNIKKQISAHKLALLKEYNVQSMLKMVGVKSEKSLTLATFHPRYGKIIYANDKNAASAVPLRLVVQERGGKVIVGYIRPSEVFANFDVPQSFKTELDTLLASIVANATQ